MSKYLLFVCALVFSIAFSQKSNAQSDQTVTNGNNTAPVVFPGTACQYSWFVNGPYIGLTAWGSGNIPSFTATNTGNSAVTATITAYPEPSGFAYVTDSASNEVAMITTPDNINVINIPVVQPVGVSINSSGTVVYITGAQGISTISTASNSVTSLIPLGWQLRGVVINPDGSRLYVAGDDSLAVIDAVSDKLITKIKTGSGAYGVAVSPDGSRVYVSNQKDNTISIITTNDNGLLTNVPVGKNPEGIAVSPDGSRVYVVNHSANTVSVINTATGLVAAAINVGKSPAAIALSPDGGTAYVSNSGSNSVSVINTTTNLVTATVNVQSNPVGVSVTPDGTKVYVANKGSNTVSVINAATNAVSTAINVGVSPIAFGNFVIGGTGCGGSKITVKITVSPTPAGVTVINNTATTGSIVACAGNASVSPWVQQFTVSGKSLNGNITASAPAGFEISLSPGGGYAGSLVIPQAGGAVNNVTVYVRSPADDPPGSISGNVSLSSAGATSVQVPVSGTINALPAVNAVPDQTVNNGATTAAVNFTGTGDIFNWVNDTPSIGLAAGGAGNIAPFTAINRGLSPVTATITVTPEPSGFAYVSNRDGYVSVINTTTNKLATTIQVGNRLNGVSVSPDAAKVYIASSNSADALWNSVAVISTAANAVTNTVAASYAPVTVAASQDGSRLFMVTYEGEDFEVLNTITGQIVSTLFVGEVPYGMAVMPDESKAYIGNFDSDTLWVVDIKANAVVKKIVVGDRPASLLISPDGSKLFVANVRAGTISVVNTATDVVMATIQLGGMEASFDGYPWGLTCSPDGARLYVANNYLNQVQVINTATYAITATIPVGKGPVGTSVTPDGAELFVVNGTDGTVSVINTASNKVIAMVNVGGTPWSVGNFISPGTGCTGKPVKFTITVNPDPVLAPTIAAGPVTGTMPACFGSASVDPNIQQFTVEGAKLTGDITVTAPDSFEVSLAAGGGFGSKVTLSPIAGTVNKTTVYVRLAATAPVGTIAGTVTMTSPGAAIVTVVVNGDVSTPVSPSVSIMASATTVCAGTPVTFTATAVNGGSSPVYQWQVNGNNAGNSSASFISSTLANGDMVTCQLTSNATCAVPAMAASNNISVAVNPALNPSISITASASAVCVGTPVIFTATPVNGGPVPVYQWQVNGNNAGTNSDTFTSSNLAEGDIITCTMTGNAPCGVAGPVTSNSLTETVYPLPTVSAGGNQTINEGSSTILNATDNGDITSITWNPATGLSNNKILNPLASPTSTTKYFITVETAGGCTAADSAIVKVIIPPLVIPNTFTPNGDGVNDTWDIKYLNYYPNCLVQVFTRWGQNIYTSIGYPAPWNGTYHNIPLSIGTYYYTINLENNSAPLSGFVTIIR